MVYLALGVLLGPTVLGIWHFNPLVHSEVLEAIAGGALRISLFASGTRMPEPFDALCWRGPVLLAALVMLVSVAAVAVFGVNALGLSPGAAILLGGLSAPTDPVLATEVETRHPGDRHRERVSWKRPHPALPPEPRARLRGAGTGAEPTSRSGGRLSRKLLSSWPEDVALELIHLVLAFVTLSILVHGVSVRPLMRLRRGPAARGIG